MDDDVSVWCWWGWLVSRMGVVVAVVLVIVEVAISVVVNWATSGLSPWLWLVLGMLVVVTCGLVWWQFSVASPGNGTRVRTRAGLGGAVENSPVDVTGSGGPVEVSTTASWWGRIRGSGTTVRR